MDLISEQPGFLSLSPEQQLSMILAVRQRRRDRALIQTSKRQPKTKTKIGLAKLNEEQLQTLLQIAKERQ